MKEDWASNRIDKWAEKHEVSQENYLILFDIRQGFNPKNQNYARPLNGFLIINLQDSFKLDMRMLDDHVGHVYLTNIDGGEILEGPMWREFVTGKGGRIVEEVQFDVLTESSVSSDFEVFKNAFDRYRIALN